MGTELCINYCQTINITLGVLLSAQHQVKSHALSVLQYKYREAAPPFQEISNHSLTMKVLACLALALVAVSAAPVEYIPGSYLVLLKKGFTIDAVADLVRDVDVGFSM